MEDFRHAYRRLASQLHPDRAGTGADVRRLQRLNVLYDSAMEFHQIHGRLPGARPLHRPTATAEREAIKPAPVESGSLRRWLLAGACLLALLLYWLGLGMREGGAPSLDPVGPGDHVAPGLFQPQAPNLALGMDATLVFRVLGQPDKEGATRWDYGPSWVEFQCGKVVGWYSSPLRPLRVESGNAHSTPVQPPGC